ncbi:hypothetical protein [Candidatus Avelusimicrobium luingense]|uniref:hypothetical protein n=1 Tax=Candidatus Avelusimicrobium luingense TaxID=3416211 RepID=UPI003D113796
MVREFLSLDFYGGEIIAALVSLDEETDTLRLRHVLRKSCKSFAGALVRDMDGAQRELTAVFNDIAQYTVNPLTVLVGLRGPFLSFKHSSGCESIGARHNRIGTHEIEAALRASIPTTLNNQIDVVDVFAQSYIIDGNENIINPKGITGFTLEAITFLTMALSSHVETLSNVFRACDCTDFQLWPTIVAQADRLVTAGEKTAGALLLDIGQKSSSAALYYQGILMDAREIDFGMERLAQAVADLLQNDLETAKDVLKTYEIGTDEVVDEVLEDAHLNLLHALKKELLQSPEYVKHRPNTLVLTGTAIDKNMIKMCKQIFEMRKVRPAHIDDLLTDCGPADLPVYSGAISLISHALAREEQEHGITQEKPAGLLDGLWSKFGELF